MSLRERMKHFPFRCGIHLVHHWHTYLSVPPGHATVAGPLAVLPRALVGLALRSVVLLEGHGAGAVRLPVGDVAHVRPVLQAQPLLVTALLHHLSSECMSACKSCAKRMS